MAAEGGRKKNQWLNLKITAKMYTYNLFLEGLLIYVKAYSELNVIAGNPRMWDDWWRW